MVAHKRAYEVTLAPVNEGRISQQWVQRYGRIALAAAALAVAVVLLVRYQSHQASARNLQGWEAVMSKTDLSALRSGEGSAALKEVVEEVRGTRAEAWACALEVMALARQGDVDNAGVALERLRSLGDQALLQERVRWGSEKVDLTLVEYLERFLQADRAWREQHSGLFGNPAPPGDAPRVRLKTSRGEIVVQLYPDRAPGHVDNFLSRVRAGSYDGTRFHRVLQGARIYGGDPYSVQDDSESLKVWGQGGKGEVVAREATGLSHFQGVLAAEAIGAGEEGSRAWQFCLTARASHDLDSDGTVFGAVVGGLDVVRAIADSVVVEGTQRPVESVVLESAVEL